VRRRVLLVDDDVAIRFGVRDYLESHGYEVVEATSCKEAEAVFERAPPDAVILDHRLPDGNALELLARLRAIEATVPVVILTAYATIELAVAAIKQGAEHFLTKPVELSALLVVLNRLFEKQRNRRKVLASQTREDRATLNPFLGSSPAIRSLAVESKQVAGSESPVLILGETGTGKGVLAQWIHEHSPRADEPFIDVNCAGLSREFLETELFGHQKGAFTGAVAAKAGLFEIAHNGTLFLDEIGDMDLEVQPKLLKALEEKRFRRLGDVHERQVDVRLIAATHRDLAALVAKEKFRRDLYFRINTFRLTVPPLRQRPEDIPLLAHDLLERLCAERGRDRLMLDAGTTKALIDYAWPGNLRELRNVIERAVVLCEGRVLRRRDLRFDGEFEQPRPTAEMSHLTLEELERLHIAHVLEEERGRVEDAAKRLGISRSSLYHKISKYRLPSKF
jgi:DNA-binding NtrC family response regulator